MRDLETIKEIVNYFNENQSTVRKTADYFGISKTSVHFYLTKVMPNATSQQILKTNKEQRHLRGGQATKNKYLSKKRSE